MQNCASRDQLIAKIQHFADALKACQIEKENLLIINPPENCQKEKAREAIFVYEEILKEYYSVFDSILHK